jgi:hypothetical protein
MSYTEINRMTRRDLRRAVAKGLEPWARCHCERVIEQAKSHAERSRDRTLPSEWRRRLYALALTELTLIQDLLGVFSTVKAGGKLPLPTFLQG